MFDGIARRHGARGPAMTPNKAQWHGTGGHAAPQYESPPIVGPACRLWPRLRPTVIGALCHSSDARRMCAFRVIFRAELTQAGCGPKNVILWLQAQAEPHVAQSGARTPAHGDNGLPSKVEVGSHADVPKEAPMRPIQAILPRHWPLIEM